MAGARATLATYLLATILLPSTAAWSLSGPALREYEKKHGRVAMAAVATLGALAYVGVDEPVKWLSQQPADDQLLFFAASGVLEAGLTLPRFREGGKLRRGLEPGRVLRFAPQQVNERASRLEDAVGRTAMLLAAGALVAGL